ncbi:unnamed protein product [Prunus armeniaca]|uniref:Uncharacterized protein n=1 Tax=Prunus armeniaca TaxID=36596 RepID=A0A6J5WEZ7_PRUAR|nr:unnamed protein product [Prunus armeniaca]
MPLSQFTGICKPTKNWKQKNTSQNHFSSCCPLWKAISSVSEVKMLKLLKQKFIIHGS